MELAEDDCVAFLQTIKNFSLMCTYTAGMSLAVAQELPVPSLDDILNATRIIEKN
jgi:hypothetical protein